MSDMKYKTIFFIFIFLINFFVITKADDLILAVLEQKQCEDDSDLMIRVLFAKNDNKWISLDNQSFGGTNVFTKITWTVAFDGRNIGQVQAIDSNISDTLENTYASINLLKVKQDTNMPKVLNKNKDFWGWCNAPKFRPLVLISKSNYNDPVKWTSFAPSKKISSQLFSEFKKVAGAAKRCLTYQGFDQVPYNYQAKDLMLFKGYQNKLGQKLISIGLNPDLYKCDGVIEPQWKPYWFLLDKQIRYIGTELDFVDAGDYDNDGKSKVIFWHSGYNEDGYSLFYNDFNSRTDFYWNYH
jgi:hypothetical protein